MLYAYPDVERRGLCNMLFPWARATIFARENNCPILAPSWVQFGRIGPWLRRERDKRYYFGQFTNQGYIKGLKKWGVIHLSRKIDEDKVTRDFSGVVRFGGLRNYFLDLKGESRFLLQELLKIVSPKILENLNKLPEKFIGVHIRRCDFTCIGQALSPDYYIRAIQIARQRSENVPVLVFSDACLSELAYLSQLKDIYLMPPAPAIQDMLSLARAKILVGTNLSTFSEWASFLGGMKSLWDREGGSVSAQIDSELV